MIVPGLSYGNTGMGRDPGDVKKDNGGHATMKMTVTPQIWLMKKREK